MKQLNTWTPGVKINIQSFHDVIKFRVLRPWLVKSSVLACYGVIIQLCSHSFCNGHSPTEKYKTTRAPFTNIPHLKFQTCSPHQTPFPTQKTGKPLYTYLQYLDTELKQQFKINWMKKCIWQSIWNI